MGPAQILEQPRAGAEQHRHEMHMNLVDAAGTQQLLADAGAEHVDVLVTGGGLCELEASMGLFTKVYTLPSGTCPGVPWETMNVGVRASPPGPSGPHQGTDRS